MKRTILIIDDEPEKSLPLVEHLQQEGYHVLFAASGNQGLEFITSEKPDIVICDLEMPDMGGYEVMEAAVTTLNMGHLPFMLMNERWEIKDWFSPSGKRSADLRIDKPFRLLEISSFINRICRYTDEEVAKSVQ